MKKLLCLMVILFLVGCNDLNRRPRRWALMLDAETREPVANYPLVYLEPQKPYFIISTLLVSREYLSDENGLVKIPSGVFMHPICPPGQKQYELAEEEAPSEIDIHGKKDVEVIYLEKVPPFTIEETENIE